MPTTNDTGHDQPDVLDRAEQYRAEIVDDREREVDQLRATVARLTRELQQTRPAPDPGWLGEQLRTAYFSAGRTAGSGASWTSVARAAIALVRGPWWSELAPAACPRCSRAGGTLPTGRICAACELEVGVRAEAVTA